MHAVSHTLSHRGPSASSRARTRWQPYSASTLPSSAPPHTHARTSPVPYLNTPASSVTSTPPHLHPVNHLDCLDRLKGHALPQSSPAGPLRDVQKAKYVTRLVDQAVKSLCEIWDPEDIPSVFNTPVRTPWPTDSASIPSGSRSGPVSTLFSARHMQLPSPITPNTRHSPLPLPSEPLASSRNLAADSSCGSSLAPIKGFVHEVLRRSRTSTGVLQTALCYLEAVRNKVPEILRNEKLQPGEEQDGDEVDYRIIIDAAYAATSVSQYAVQHPGQVGLDDVSLSDTGCMADSCPEAAINALPKPESAQSGSTHMREALYGVTPSTIPLPLPPLPSPLLCPRRTFLACLILASKFMQDRSYSNRAWAKLAGLPPREIGRCERALGDALGWRLWVGKGVNTSGRSLTRSRSDGNLLASSTATATSATWSSPSTSALVASTPAQTPSNGLSSGLRRHATMPNLSVGSSASSCGIFGDVSLPTCGLPQEEDANAFGTAFATDMEATQPSEAVFPTLTTPTLTFSPLSTASSSSDSSDDRTIQMATFADVPTPSPVFRFAPCVSGWNRSGVGAADTAIDPKVIDVPEFVMAGPKLAAIEPVVASGVPCSLPSLSEALSGTYDSMYNYWV